MPELFNSPFINNSEGGKQFRKAYMGSPMSNGGDIHESLLPKHRAFIVTNCNLEKDMDDNVVGWVEVNKHWFRVDTLIGPEDYKVELEKLKLCKCCGQALPKLPVPFWFTAMMKRITSGHPVVLVSRNVHVVKEVLPSLLDLLHQEGYHFSASRANGRISFPNFRQGVSIISAVNEQHYLGYSASQMVLMDNIGFYNPHFINWYYYRGTHDYNRC